MIESFTYPMRFGGADAGAAAFDDVERRALLDLPFSGDLVDGAVFADDVGLRRAPARTPLARRDAATD